MIPNPARASELAPDGVEAETLNVIILQAQALRDELTRVMGEAGVVLDTAPDLSDRDSLAPPTDEAG